MPASVRILGEKCDGCAACVPACPFLALEVVEGKAMIYESCLECGACVTACPAGAIWTAGEESKGGGAAGTGASRGRSLWVYVPRTRNGAAGFAGDGGGEGAPLARGGLALARSLADEQGARVAAVTADASADTATLFAGGADEVVVLEGYGPARVLLAAAAALEAPAAVLSVAAGEAQEVVAGAAALAGAPLISGADEVESFGERLAPIRPLYGGRFRAKVRAAEGLVPFITLDRHVFRSARADPRRTGVVRRLAVTETGATAAFGAALAAPVIPGAPATPGTPGTPSILGTPAVAGERRPAVPLDAARIILGGGAELGSAENFALLHRLADRLATVAGDVAVGATKEAVDAGWAPREALLDGTTIKTCPALYMAFGVEGTPAHNAAVSLARVVVSVTAHATSQFCQVADFILPYAPDRVLARLLEIPL